MCTVMDSFLKRVFVRAGKTHDRSGRAPTHHMSMPTYQHQF